jgi:polyferredoxin
MSEQIPIKDVTPVKIKDTNIVKPSYSVRNRIYVRSVQGIFKILRQSLGLFMIGLFAVAPWIQYEGSQALLFDLAKQRFQVFGLTLWPQDLTVVAYSLIVSAFALFFVTTFAGRVWCGFTCPQTAWTHLFIWFEEKFEGLRNKRIKLDQRKMDLYKFMRKVAKHSA